MIRRLAFLLFWLLPAAALAQDSSGGDGGMLTRWLESNLSGAGREVRIEGFSGALSSTARLGRLTIADENGIWLTMTNARLDWNRTAILRGNLEVNELSAETIELARRPSTENAAPRPEAGGPFSLPELPVSIRIGQVSVDEVTIGASVLGTPARVSLAGSLELAGGEGRTDLTIERIDGSQGSLTLDGSFSNATGLLDLTLQLVEEADGLLASLLDIPGHPSIGLDVTGSGPLSDYTARIALQTHNEPRVRGSVELRTETEPGVGATRHFRSILYGDISPLLAEEFREFVGTETILNLAGALLPDQRLELSTFQMKSAALDATGTLTLSPDRLPEAFDLAAIVTPVTGEDIVLPIGGPETRITTATLWGNFKAGRGDEWQLNGDILGLRRDGIAVEDAAFQASGLIQRVETDTGLARRVTASVRTEVFGLDLGDAAINEAVGDRGVANAIVEWQDGQPIRIGLFDLVSGDLRLFATGSVDGLDQQFRVTGDVSATIGSLTRFAALSGQPLQGAANASLRGWFEPLGGAFDGTLDAATEGLSIGSGPVQDMVRGSSTLSAQAQRGQTGIELQRLALQTAGLSAEASGALRTGGSSLDASIELRDIGTLVSGISGPARLGGNLRQSGEALVVDFAGSGPGGIELAINGRTTPDLSNSDLRLTGAVPIGLANAFIAAPVDVQGTARLDLALNGPPSVNFLSGTISTSDTRVAAPTFRVAMRDVEGQVAVSGGTARLDLSGGFSSGGRLIAGGSVGLTPGYDSDILLELRTAEFTDSRSYAATLNGNLALRGPITGGARLAGEIDIQDAEIRLAPMTSVKVIPDIAHSRAPGMVTETLRRAGLLGDEAAGGGSSGAALALDVLINAPNRVFIRGRGLDTELGGSLRITGTTAQVIPIGQFNLVRGRLDILGKRLDMQEGQLLVQGTLDPWFRLVAGTSTSDATVRIVTQGTASAPEFLFESDPDLPEDEILAQLLFGRSITSISPLQAAQLASAVATLTGSGGDGILGSLREGAALDDIDITTDEDGRAALRVGKYLNSNVYTDVNLDSEGRTQINLNLDVTSNVIAKGSVSSDGQTGIGVFFERDY